MPSPTRARRRAATTYRTAALLLVASSYYDSTSGVQRFAGFSGGATGGQRDYRNAW